jgi:hypothetical protein
MTKNLGQAHKVIAGSLEKSMGHGVAKQMWMDRKATYRRIL